jgi:hypothetical protein
MKKKNGRIGQIEGRGRGKEDEREGWDEGEGEERRQKLERRKG